jgi:hypothetical protein
MMTFNIRGFFLKTTCLVLVASSFLFCDKKKITANEIVSKSIDAHGGFNQWKQIDTLSFVKKTVLYTKKGLKEKEIKQYQSFSLGSSFNGAITSLGSDSTSLTLTNGLYSKSIGDSLLVVTEKELPALKNAFKAAYYVVSQPFNLRESTASLLYVKDTVLKNKKTYVVNVSYKGDTENSDLWTYYFDAQTFLVVACKVYHSPTMSFILNTKFDSLTPFVFNAERESVFLKADATKDYLRAAYFYSDYKVVLKRSKK